MLQQLRARCAAYLPERLAGGAGGGSAAGDCGRAASLSTFNVTQNMFKHSHAVRLNAVDLHFNCRSYSVVHRLVWHCISCLVT